LINNKYIYQEIYLLHTINLYIRLMK